MQVSPDLMLWTAPPPAREWLLDVAADPNDDRVPETARDCVAALGAQLRMLKAQILDFDRRIMAWRRAKGRLARALRRLGQPPFFGAQEWVA